MTTKRKLLLFMILAVSAVSWTEAQNNQRKLEINAGISTPGMIELQDVKLIDWGLDDYDYLIYDKPLSDLVGNAYNSTVYPCFSIEASYKLADSGFLKRLNLVGLVGFHYDVFEEIDIVRNNSNKENAKKLDILIGIRYDIIKNTFFNMYTQALVGKDICDKSRYWDIINEKWSNERLSIFQLTYLGFNWRIGRRDSRLGAMIELGYGYEYAAGELPFVPGIRTGFSYKF